jgi:hypothetical protein
MYVPPTNVTNNTLFLAVAGLVLWCLSVVMLDGNRNAEANLHVKASCPTLVIFQPDRSDASLALVRTVFDVRWLIHSKHKAYLVLSSTGTSLARPYKYVSF